MKLAFCALPYLHKINYAKSDSLIDRSDQSDVVGGHEALPLIFPHDVVRDTWRTLHSIIIVSVLVFQDKLRNCLRSCRRASCQEVKSDQV